MSMTSNPEIIEKIRKGGVLREKAIHHLIEKNRYLLKLKQASQSLRQEEIEEAFMDAILKLVRAIENPAFPTSSNLGGLLKSIFSNLCVDTIRKNTSQKKGGKNSKIELLESIKQRTDNPEEQLITEEIMAAGKECLAGLSEKCQMILILKEEGYSSKEIAEKLAYNKPSVVDATFFRCRKRFVNCIEKFLRS